MWQWFKKRLTEAAPPAPAAPKDLYEDASDFEVSRLFFLEESRRQAWLITYGAGALALLSWVALVLLMPLKRVEPYVIRVDSATGVPDIVTTLTEENVSGDEVVQKYFLAKYVRARETYDWHTLQVDYEETRLFSSGAVGLDYAEKFKGDGALDQTLGAGVQIHVEIQSVVPTSPSTGTVRFITTRRRADDPKSGQKTRWVATLGFRFNSPSALKESERLVNPFGFQVTSYRVDPELGGGSQ